MVKKIGQNIKKVELNLHNWKKYSNFARSKGLQHELFNFLTI